MPLVPPPPRCSPIWKGVLTTAAPFHASLAFHLGDGKTISFWHSRWAGDSLLRNRFPSLFAASPLKHLVVNSWLRRLASSQNFGFPALSSEGSSELPAFRLFISSITQSPGPYSVFWRWDRHGCFSTRSASYFLVFDGVDDNRVRHLWRIRIPPKVKLFLWLAARNRIMTADTLSKCGWIGPSMCCLCGLASENLEHLFFLCSYSSHVWTWILPGEHSITAALLATDGCLAERWLRTKRIVKGSRKHLLDLCVAATCWEIWSERNQRIISGELGGSFDCGAEVENTVNRWIAALGN